jgi:hypothetical protein
MRVREPRVPYGAWVETNETKSPNFFLAEDLTLDGLRLRADGLISEVEGAVRLRLLVENESEVLAFDAEVVDDGEGGLTLQFVNLDPYRETFLAELLAEKGGAQQKVIAG